MNFELNEGKRFNKGTFIRSIFQNQPSCLYRFMVPSVTNAVELKRRGIDSLGVIKTNHKNYPRVEIESMCVNEASICICQNSDMGSFPRKET